MSTLTRHGSGKVMGETSCLSHRQNCHWDETLSTQAPASSLHETVVYVDCYNKMDDAETLLGTATVDLKKTSLNAHRPSEWQDIVQRGSDHRGLMGWFESTTQGEPVCDEAVKCEVERKRDADVLLLWMFVTSPVDVIVLQLLVFGVNSSQREDKIAGQLLVQSRWEMKDDDEEECQRLVEEIKRRCENDDYLRNILFGIVQKWKHRSMQSSFKALHHHMMAERFKGDMAAKWEALGVSKFLWEWQHVIEKKNKAKKKEKIQLRTLRNCHQNKSLPDMLTTRLGVDEWSIKIISNALRTEAEIQAERVEKAEQLAKRVRKDQARQALEGWWDVVFAKDTFKRND
ncbi:hypothetical protein GUITHDRAFT_117221 [Guillardia theta CCMP2712]|uniref:Uncharacterized protein n=1 Tax=Guillardia theta (strain CCMP2712) TaxID=905079 RepID=L1IK00_GUITC|nr:hypothetical protein GUITHDRAFT_117221 [Guillardia theta CCMP2712]EKX36566.1 hypothetical protein GUITHDRAFT_117221 [Guillardia theta CCMP2712]|eukprot:XP_005823546.1 hypothetical protein GUITHDRAFT_117221 [Guillardia theta CCMP2712]